MKKMMTLLMVPMLMTLSLISHAQTPSGKVSGHVIDGSQKVIAAATITLVKAKDSSVAKIGAASKDGDFVFEGVPAGRYLVAITATGHKKAWSDAFELSAAKTSVNLPTIELVPVAKDLAAVTVTARKPLIEQHIDRMVVNVEAAVTNVGATALEVLEKSPGVTVDKDGNISLKGKQGVQIFVDGKPSYLSGADLVNLLSNMSASQLEQIEIMTNPPAKYDAAGNSGIINIKTKKNKLKGFNGSVNGTYSQGRYARTNESLNMNYRNGKVNLFANYSFNYNRQWKELDIHRSYLNMDGKTVKAMFDQVALMPNINRNHNLKFGMDYFVDKKTTLGCVASGFLSPSDNDNYNTSYLKNAQGQTDSIVQSVSLNHRQWKNGSLNLNFRHEYDSTGRELSADLDYAGYRAGSDQFFTNSSYFADMTPKGQTQLDANLPVNIDIYTAKMDYTHPLKKGAKLETGVKTSFVNTDNSANYFNIYNGIQTADYTKTNRFKYNENINAAYVNYNRQMEKFGVQIGLRFENTHYKGHQLGNPQRQDSLFDRTYSNLFPTAYFTYKLSKNHMLGLSFGRRIDRPAYEDLNPFLFFIDNYTYEAGNPFVKPQYSNNLELSHTFKGILITTVNYSRTTDLMNETFDQSGYATIVRKGNIGLRQNAGLSMSAQLTPAKCWNASVYVNYNYSRFQGPLYGEYIDISASNVTFNMNNQFRLGNGWSAELSGWARSKGVEGQILISGMGQANAGVSKQIMKNKATIRASIRDIFLTNWAQGDINFQQTQAHFKNLRDSRVASISFTYRFGKPIKDQRVNRKKGGADEEQSRVKGGN
ncbi:MAG: TonB-dependent receptor [Bacteroidetes bacterium]|nr:TonB-dependent receptor [Bacteroidota bacterium]